MTEKEEVLLNLELLRCEVEKKTEPANYGAPELITIEHDDYHAKYIGRTHEGLQFFVTNLFVPAVDQPGNEFLAVFLFNDAGDLVDSKVDELGPRSTLNLEDARALRAQRLKELGNMEFQNIQVKSFAIEHYGVMMGLIPSKFEDQWWVELLPGNCMAFHKPWDSGMYDT